MTNTKSFPTKMENEPRPCTLVTLLHRAVDCSQRDKARGESGTNCYIQQEYMRKNTLHRPEDGRRIRCCFFMLAVNMCTLTLKYIIYSYFSTD